MILSVGGYKIDTRDIVMVLDIDHLTVTKRGQEIFSGRTREKIVVTDEEELPLSALVVCEKDKKENTIYLTPLTPQTLLKHLGAERDKESRDVNIWW